jgi:hypothetical protein
MMANSNENGIQPILVILKLAHFVSELMLEGIQMRTVISGLTLHALPPIKFNVDVMECVVMAATDNQEWQEAYNAPRDSNISANIEDLHRALYY